MIESRQDVVVIGAGPAGSVAALALARSGREVLLVDKARFPRFKVCGCCLSAKTVGVLRGLGLGDRLDASGAWELSRFRVAARGRRLELPLPSGTALTRSALDSLLANAAREAGARFLDATRATVLRTVPGTVLNTSRLARTVPARTVPGTVLAGDPRRVTLDDGERRAEIEAGLVLVADGLAGTAFTTEEAMPVVHPTSRLGAGAILEGSPAATVEPGVVHMAVGRGGYVGMVRVEDRSESGRGEALPRVAVAAALDEAALRGAGGMATLACEIVERAGGLVPPGLEGATWRGTPSLTRRRPVSHAGVLLLGDAAGYVEPFTGQGIEWAVRSGLEIAGLVVANGSARPQDGTHAPFLEAAWLSRHRSLVLARQRACRLLIPVLRHEGWMAALLQIASWRPTLLARLVRHVAG